MNIDTRLPEPLLRLLDANNPPRLDSTRRAGVLDEAAIAAALIPVVKAASGDPRVAELLRALVLLWHDHADATHRIVQVIEDPDGNYLHGIVHRREPDYWNAKYWFRRVGTHPIFPNLAAQAPSAPAGVPDSGWVRRLAPAKGWDPLAWVDGCEALSQPGTPATAVAAGIALQATEFQLLALHLLNFNR